MRPTGGASRQRSPCPLPMPEIAASERPKRSAVPLSRSQCDRLRAFVALRLDQTLGPKDMAAIAGLSARHFHRAFKLSFGITPYAYVLDARLRHAASLLQHTNVPLRDVAAASGFFDQAHLCNAFRRRYGLPPHQWREQYGSAAGPDLSTLPHTPAFESVTLPPILVSRRHPNG